MTVTSPSSSPQDRAVDALLELLALNDWAAINLSDVAARAGMDLAELRRAYPSKGAILSGFAKKIDQQVLAPQEGIEGQPARERLFDVMMRRFDALKPYKLAIASARRGLLADPLAASSWNSVEVNSAQWMMAAAGIQESGPYAALQAQGLAVIFAKVLGTFLEDDDPDLTATMRQLDIQLRRAERVVETGNMVRDAGRPVLSALESLLPRSRRRRQPEDPAAAI